MEKKNTMLLTVIAVATLLVAVVGATFAYFSLTVDNQSTATEATVKIASAATATLSGENQKLHLAVSAVDMSADKQDTTYYAIAESDDAYGTMKETSSIYSTSEKKYEVSRINLQNAAEGTKYTCGYKITVTANKDLSSLTEGDVVLKLEYGVGATVTAVSELTALDSIDLNEFKTASENKVEKTGTFELDGTNVNGAVFASLALKNTNSDKQGTTLANQDFTITIASAGNGACSVAAAGAGA